jgi:PEP-CTERM motif
MDALNSTSRNGTFLQSETVPALRGFKVKSTLLMMTVAAGALGLSGAASADIVTVTYTGPVILVSDAGGTVPAASEGDTLVASYVFNLPNADPAHTLIGPTDGGFASGAYGSFVTASLTINGVAALLPAFATGQLTGETNVFEAGTVLSANVNGAVPNTSDQLESLLNSHNFSWNLSPPLGGLSYTVSPDDEDAVTQLTTAAGDLLEADIATVTVTVSSSSPVPEPSTWAMLVLGFAGLGYAGFRQSRARAATVA